MSLQDPIAVFTASSNVRAQELSHMLNQSGVEAHVIEDFSLVGLWMGGTIPGVHRPQIWVERANAELAAAILQQHAQRESELQAVPPSEAETPQLRVVCEECNQPATFPARQRGSVQECPHCGAYLDVEVEEELDDWDTDDDSSDQQ